MRCLTLVGVMVCLVSCSGQTEPIDEAFLKRVVETLSADELEGRSPASEGDRLTGEAIIGFMTEIGLEPGAANGSWEQPFEMVGLTSSLPETWSFRNRRGESVDLAWWDEYIAATGLQRERTTIDDAELVFVGYGITAPEEEWDDFKRADLRGKVLVFMNNDPDWDDDLFGGTRRLYYGRWTYKYERAAQAGAAGAIIVHTTPSAGYPFQVVQNSWTGEQFELPAGDEPRTPVTGWVTEDAAGRLFALAGHDWNELQERARSREFEPVPLEISTSLEVTASLRRGTRTANILGLLRGRDPELSRQLIVYTAHHDHLGVGEPDASGDTIYNGARDNATGVATILAAARAFAALPEPPRRSILFLTVAAEEQGLLGSRWFCANPTAHPGRIAANLNFDAVNIFGPTRDVAVIGPGKSSLETLLADLAAEAGREVVGEPFPDKGYYYRSDQFNFAKIGVPALYFKGGTEFIGRPEGWGREMEERWRSEKYHQPSDEIDEDWSWEGMVEDARLAFRVGHAAAEADELPSWTPGDEFEAVRHEMLRAAETAP